MATISDWINSLSLPWNKMRRFLHIPVGKITFSVAKASGPGGQNVNKSKLGWMNEVLKW